MSRFKQRRFGEIKPLGWIRKSMEKDLKGFVGNLDRLVPDLIMDDDIYGEDRLSMKVKDKNVGAIADGGEWEVQFLWWNSETQSNWRDGFVRHALLLDDQVNLEKTKAYVDKVLKSQDEDGYIGIYDEDLRYNFTGENGELWAQSSLFRVLLGYYEGTGDERALKAVIRGMEVTMEAYPMYESEPFNYPDSFAGLAHGLTITDALYRLFCITDDEKYLAYGVFLYEDYCKHEVSEKDIQIEKLLDEDYKFQGHGVHTYEHLRALLIAMYGSLHLSLVRSGDEGESYKAKYLLFSKGKDAYLDRLKKLQVPSGGPIGDEWIFGQYGDAGKTAYEYCSIHELIDGYGLLMELSGDLSVADDMEWLLYNGAQGSKHVEDSSICYLKLDNSYSLVGRRDYFHEYEDDETQTRFRYSPSHQEAAVCCVPNAGRVMPYFVKSMVMNDDDGLAVALYGPCVFEGQVNGKDVLVRQETEYPYDYRVRVCVECEEASEFSITLRKPSWSACTTVMCDGAEIVDHGEVIVVRKAFNVDVIDLEFVPEVVVKKDLLGDWFVTYGPLLYAFPIDGETSVTKEFGFGGFRELEVAPVSQEFRDMKLMGGHEISNRIGVKKVKCDGGGCDVVLDVPVIVDGKEVVKEFVSFGDTVLRRVTFPVV